MSPESLLKPQRIIVPPINVAGAATATPLFEIFTSEPIELSPATSVPVSYQRQLTSIYLPAIVSVVFDTPEPEPANNITGTASLIATLTRDGEPVWIGSANAALSTIHQNAEKLFSQLEAPALLAEDFTNPIVVSPGSRLALQLAGSVLVEKTGAPAATGLLSGVSIGRINKGEYGVYPALGPGIIHYSLSDGS